MPAVLAAGQEERADRGGLHLKAALMGLEIRAFAASCCLLFCASLHCVDPSLVCMLLQCVHLLGSILEVFQCCKTACKKK